MEEPLAYLLTFTAYGSHLHGQPSGSVSRLRHSWDRDFVPDCPALLSMSEREMRESAYTMSAAVRLLVANAIQAACRKRGWVILALHVRSTHVHAVMRFQEEPRRVVDTLKASASRELNKRETDRNRVRRWTRGRSARRLWTVEQVRAAIDYVLNQQGEPMETFQDSEALANLEGR